MLKKILRYLRYIVIAVLAVFCVFALVMVDRGRKLASSVMEETPISAAVEPYFSMSTWTDYEDLDPKFVEAVVSVEDQRYFKRYGFDWPALIRAVFNNMMARSFVEGGSTISQQIAKNLYFQSGDRENCRSLYHVPAGGDVFEADAVRSLCEYELLRRWLLGDPGGK